VGWDTLRDQFTLGQWLKGRIFERRCDLSPDGKHFIYLAFQWNKKGNRHGSWTAISMAPYLKAIGFWDAGGFTWNGGGLFISDSTYWLNAWEHFYHDELVPKGLRRDKAFPFHTHYGGECPGVYYIRLQRDGWNLIREPEKGQDGVTVFEKKLPGGWTLVKAASAIADPRYAKGLFFDTHQLRRAGCDPLDFLDWEWADWDHDRLVWVEKGILKATRLTPDGLGEVKTLYDFNPMEFQEVKAPYEGDGRPVRAAPH
jgi:hypothetical protein